MLAQWKVHSSIEKGLASLSSFKGFSISTLWSLCTVARLTENCGQKAKNLAYFQICVPYVFLLKNPKKQKSLLRYFAKHL
jgi:hypothetical protein